MSEELRSKLAEWDEERRKVDEELAAAHTELLRVDPTDSEARQKAIERLRRAENAKKEFRTS